MLIFMAGNACPQSLRPPTCDCPELLLPVHCTTNDAKDGVTLSAVEAVGRLLRCALEPTPPPIIRHSFPPTSSPKPSPRSPPSASHASHARVARLAVMVTIMLAEMIEKTSRDGAFSSRGPDVNILFVLR